MAKAKKAAPPKKAVPAKRTTPAKNPQAPVRVIVEVIVRNETVAPLTHMLKGGGGMELLDAPLDVRPPNFEFALEREGVAILGFMVGDRDVDPNGESKFFAPVLDPNPDPRIRVVLLARKELPTGTCSLTLKYNGKNIPASPISLTFENNERADFNERVKLL